MKDGVYGILEFKLVEEMQPIERALIGSLTESGQMELHGAVPRGLMIREIGEHIQDTWRDNRPARKGTGKGKGTRAAGR